MTTPRWLLPYLSEDGAKQIERAVVEAEQQTSGEVVVVVVRRSSALGHVVPLLFCLLLIVLLLLDPAAWENRLLEAPLVWLCINLLILLGLAHLLGVLAPLQRLLTAQADQQRQTELRAEVEFYENGLNGTKGRTGVLLFVSLLEHRAIVLADQAISGLVSPTAWSEVLATIVAGIKQRKMAEGICTAVKQTADVLAEHFPRGLDDHDELRNSVVIKE